MGVGQLGMTAALVRGATFEVLNLSRLTILAKYFYTTQSVLMPAELSHKEHWLGEWSKEPGCFRMAKGVGEIMADNDLQMILDALVAENYLVTSESPSSLIKLVILKNNATQDDLIKAALHATYWHFTGDFNGGLMWASLHCKSFTKALDARGWMGSVTWGDTGLRIVS